MVRPGTFCYNSNSMETEDFKRSRPFELRLIAHSETEAEIVEEQAQALSRVSKRIEQYLNELGRLNSEIERSLREGDLKRANALIERFNETRQLAHKYLYFLVVQREAIGFRIHPDMSRIFPIPPRKKRIDEAQIQQDHHSQ
ncbi:MAG: hypothetical protein DRG31_01085 [Deltaproteobacteria bacterium]|nr:MAG: hypothetical protein DRG31_01085 [Deltaproteobacteria bacterium]